MENKEFKIPIKKSGDTSKRPFSEQYNEDIESANMMNIDVERVGTFTPPAETAPVDVADDEFVFDRVDEPRRVQNTEYPTSAPETYEYKTEETDGEPVIDADPFKIDTGSAFFDREYATVVNDETVEPNVEKHINYAEGKTPVETLVIGGNVRYIKAYAFAGFASLKTVVFESDPEIEKGAFSLCPRLENVVYKYGVTPQNIFDFFGIRSSAEVSGSYNRVKINNAPEVPEAILTDVNAEMPETAPEVQPETPAETPVEAPAEQPTVTTEDESVYGMPNASTEEIPTEQYTEYTPDTDVTETPEEAPAEETPVAEEPEAKKKKGGFFSGLFGGKDKGAKAKDAPQKTAGLDFEEEEPRTTIPAPRAKTDVKELDVMLQKPLFNGVCGVKSTFPIDATVIVVPNFVKLPNKAIGIDYVASDFFHGIAQDYPSIRTIILPSGIEQLDDDSVQLISLKRYSVEISPRCMRLAQQLEDAGISVTLYNESDYYDEFPG